MKLFQKETKSGNEVEIDFCLQKDNWAVPLFLSWWYPRQKILEGHLMTSFDFNIHFLCFSLHFTYWKWGKNNDSKQL